MLTGDFKLYVTFRMRIEDAPHPQSRRFSYTSARHASRSGLLRSVPAAPLRIN